MASIRAASSKPAAVCRSGSACASAARNKRMFQPSTSVKRCWIVRPSRMCCNSVRGLRPGPSVFAGLDVPGRAGQARQQQPLVIAPLGARRPRAGGRPRRAGRRRAGSARSPRRRGHRRRREPQAADPRAGAPPAPRGRPAAGPAGTGRRRDMRLTVSSTRRSIRIPRRADRAPRHRVPARGDHVHAFSRPRALARVSSSSRSGSNRRRCRRRCGTPRRGPAPRRCGSGCSGPCRRRGLASRTRRCRRRARTSMAATICMQRSFGQPVMVPPGNTAAIVSPGVVPGRRHRPRTLLTMWCTWA